MVVTGFGIAAISSSSVPAAQAEKTNQCGISGTVHSEQQQVGDVQGGNFGKAVGTFNRNPNFKGSTEIAHELQKQAATGANWSR